MLLQPSLHSRFEINFDMTIYECHFLIRYNSIDKIILEQIRLFFYFIFLFFQMCSYETIFNYFGRLTLTYEMRLSLFFFFSNV
jgi:hypothetical protein